jgi:hypothetical protein
VVAVVVVVVVAVMVVMMVVIVIAMAMVMVMVMVDVMISIMIGRNNCRAPWQAGEDRVCLREQERFVLQLRIGNFRRVRNGGFGNLRGSAIRKHHYFCCVYYKTLVAHKT